MDKSHSIIVSILFLGKIRITHGRNLLHISWFEQRMLDQNQKRNNFSATLIQKRLYRIFEGSMILLINFKTAN